MVGVNKRTQLALLLATIALFLILNRAAYKGYFQDDDLETLATEEDAPDLSSAGPTLVLTGAWADTKEKASRGRSGMIQAESPLGHHLFQVTITERIAQIPTKAEDDDLVLKVSPTKQCRPLVLHSLTLPESTQRVCDRTNRPVQNPIANPRNLTPGV